MAKKVENCPVVNSVGIRVGEVNSTWVDDEGNLHIEMRIKRHEMKFILPAGNRW